MCKKKQKYRRKVQRKVQCVDVQDTAKTARRVAVQLYCVTSDFGLGKRASA